MDNNSIIGLIYNVTLLLTLALIFTLFQREMRGPKWLLQLALGIVIGFAGFLIMTTAVKLSGGGIFDTRSILIGATGMFFGLLPTLVAGSMMVAYRIIIGGSGIYAGILVISTTGLLGVLWHHYRLNKILNKKSSFKFEFYFFGVITHIVMLLCMFAFPKEQIESVLKSIAIPVLVLYPIGTYLLCILLANQFSKSELQLKLKENEKKYRRIAENISDVIWVVDNNLKLLYISPSAEKLIGEPSDKYMGRNMEEKFPPEFLNEIRSIITEEIGNENNPQIHKDRTRQIETKMYRADGSTFWVSMHISFIREDDGSIIGFQGITRDISERKNAEEALKESEDRYRNIFALESDSLFIIDHETTSILEANNAASFVYGYSIEEFLKMKITDISAEPEETLKTIEEIQGTYTLIPIRYHKRKNGSKFPVEITASIFKMDNRNVILISIRDITDRVNSAEKLQSKQKELMDIIEFLPDATLGIDMEKRVIIWNKAIEKMTGIAAPEMIGKGEYAYTIPFYGDARPQLMDLVLDYNEEVAGRYKNMKREDEALVAEVFCPALHNNKGAWIYTKASPLHDSAGKIIGVIESIRDITEKKESEELIRASEEKYRLITENISDVIWIYNVSKEKFAYLSPSIYKLRGITVQEGINEKLEDALTSESLSLVKETMIKDIKYFIENPNEENSQATEIQQPCKNGDIIWVEIVTRYRYNANGEIEIVGTSRNIDERKRTEEEIRYLSFHDHLTNLYNRRFYEEELTRLDTPRNLPMTIVMGDVNGLKLINDSFGHNVGDELLKKTADAIKCGCREDDIVARLGGDEFVIILPNTDSIETEKIIQRINTFLSNEKVGSINLSVSFGFQTKHEKDEKIQDVFKDTEDNMYRHKLYESSSMRSKTIDLIMNTLYEKNHREMLHSKRVSEICESLARKLNLEKDTIKQIKIAGLMHDIGKIGIDEKILNKPEKLTDEEWNEIKKHSEIGYRILSSVNEFSEVANYVLEHQEKWDGSGYPRGLKGKEISIQARIISIADAYDAMTSQRAYSSALTQQEAIDEILKYSGVQFDPEIVKVFAENVINKNFETFDNK
ncbi:MAG: PAS domain S-box protein [Eubacteriales bacterium]